MPALVIDNTAQIRLIWQYQNLDVAVNVYHGIKQDPIGSIDQADATKLAQELATQFGLSTLKANLNTSWKLATVGVRDLNSANNPEYLAAVAGSSGTYASEILPLNVAMCVTLRTGKAGTSYRGRSYISGWTEGSSTGGNATAAVQSQAEDWITRVKNALDTSGFTLAVASRKLGKSEAVTSIQARDTRWDTQRRRIVPGI